MFYIQGEAGHFLKNTAARLFSHKGALGEKKSSVVKWQPVK